MAARAQSPAWRRSHAPLLVALVIAVPACSSDRPVGSPQLSNASTSATDGRTAATPSAGSTQTRGTRSASPDPLAGAPLGNLGCHPTSPLGPANSVPGIETRLTPDGINGWALLWERPPWVPGKEVKVVWRVSGSGELVLIAHGPEGTEVRPSFGPERHMGSNYNRPGDEWGSGFILPSPGCWELEVVRGESSASIWLLVEKAHG